MPDWTKSMLQSFEYYVVNPNTWEDSYRLNNIKACSITRDSTADTLGSATFEAVGLLGESYIRVYLITIQNGLTERHPLGTYLVQTPSSSFDGKIRSASMDAYSPLVELKENLPPYGYMTAKDSDIMATAYELASEHMRAPVIKPINEKKLNNNFIANTDDTWFSYIADLVQNADYIFDIDEYGRIMFGVKTELEAMQPIWTYNDDNSSILYPDMSLSHDLFGIPNVLEVIYSSNSSALYSIAENTDPTSPTSIPNRGRRITQRITNPNLGGFPTQSSLDDYAENALKEMSSIEYEVSYKHGYCPVRVGDCVRINYRNANMVDVKAKVISQTIKCSTGCEVSEKAVYTAKLWR